MLMKSQSTFCMYKMAQHCALNNIIGVFHTVCAQGCFTIICVPLGIQIHFCYCNETHQVGADQESKLFWLTGLEAAQRTGLYCTYIYCVLMYYVLITMKRALGKAGSSTGRLVVSRKDMGCFQAVVGKSSFGERAGIGKLPRQPGHHDAPIGCPCLPFIIS